MPSPGRASRRVRLNPTDRALQTLQASDLTAVKTWMLNAVQLQKVTSSHIPESIAPDASQEDAF
jgi:hypothetical protein